MIFIAVLWLLQDLAQVTLMGICVVPDVFMLCTLFAVLLPRMERTRQSRFIWLLFIGELLWDLRWTNLPGLTSAVACMLVGISCIIWDKIPSQGRSVGVFATLAFVCEILSSAVYYFFWTFPSAVSQRLIIVQQCVAVPIILLLSAAFWEKREIR
ncbi:MAG: hypothetical protein Q4E17_00505 [Synergistes sp.]|nr:hypothetical protein [Synergistes sp.]